MSEVVNFLVQGQSTKATSHEKSPLSIARWSEDGARAMSATTWYGVSMLSSSPSLVSSVPSDNLKWVLEQADMKEEPFLQRFIWQELDKRHPVCRTHVKSLKPAAWGTTPKIDERTMTPLLQ